MADFDEGISIGILFGRNGKRIPPDILTYKDDDPDYELPEDVPEVNGETLDSVTEYFAEKDVTRVWGIGVLNKGTDDETVNRMIYPAGHVLKIIGFNGTGGLS